MEKHKKIITSEAFCQDANDNDKKINYKIVMYNITNEINSLYIVLLFSFFQVHTLFSSCSIFEWLFFPPCVCGIAVRVEDSLFVYRTCAEISYRISKPLIHHDTVYHICDSRHMVVEPGKVNSLIKAHMLTKKMLHLPVLNSPFINNQLN